MTYDWHSPGQSANQSPGFGPGRSTRQEDGVPTYVYACTACEHRFEAQQAFTDSALTQCPECTGRLRKLFNSVGIVFKGSGFYRTDSRGKTGDVAPAAASSSSESSGSSSSSGSSEGGSAKPAAASTSSGSSASSSSGSSGPSSAGKTSAAKTSAA
jgi:putative FmdB family regulatory protein